MRIVTFVIIYSKNGWSPGIDNKCGSVDFFFV